MRVIEQLVQHFWTRGAITREDALYLAKHGFVRESDLPGLVDEEPAEDESPRRKAPADADEKARRAEELEEELAGRQGGGKKGGRKKKPSGHNLAPAAAALAGHFAAREPFAALVEWAAGIRPRRTWVEAARVIAAAKPADLEAALVGLLNARPRALGELWFWFDLEPLYEWAADRENAGPVADGLGKLMRAANRNEVGRLGQLMKAPEVQALADLLDARRKFLGLLPVLYSGYLAKLGQWLVPPAGDAAAVWPALPWAFVIVYNAHKTPTDSTAGTYRVDPMSLPFRLLKVALATAYPIAPVAVRELVIHHVRERPEPIPNPDDHQRNAVFDRPLYCPHTWRV